MTDGVLDEESIETGVPGRGRHLNRSRSRRRGEKVGDDAIVYLREETVLEVEPRRRWRNGDPAAAGELVGDVAVARGWQLRQRTAFRRRLGGGGANGGGGGVAGGVDSGGRGEGESPPASPSPSPGSLSLILSRGIVAYMMD